MPMAKKNPRSQTCDVPLGLGVNPIGRVSYTTTSGFPDEKTARSILTPSAQKYFNVIKWRREVESIELEHGKGVVSTDRIFRYLSKDRFVEMICSHQNAMAHISLWEDPLEGFVFKAPATSNFLAATRIGEYKDIFGQSWTLCDRESDLRWRAYCPNGDGVRVETTVGDLKRALKKAFGERIEDCCVLGKIHYLDENEARTLTVPPTWQTLLPTSCADMVKLLFLKRDHFREEDEYRVVCNCSPRGFVQHKTLLRKGGALKPQHGLLRCNFRGVDWIRSILFDPRMAEQQADRIRCVMAQEGIRCPSEQSRIYEWPRFKF